MPRHTGIGLQFVNEAKIQIDDELDTDGESLLTAGNSYLRCHIVRPTSSPRHGIPLPLIPGTSREGGKSMVTALTCPVEALSYGLTVLFTFHHNPPPHGKEPSMGETQLNSHCLCKTLCAGDLEA